MKNLCIGLVLLVSFGCLAGEDKLEVVGKRSINAAMKLYCDNHAKLANQIMTARQRGLELRILLDALGRDNIYSNMALKAYGMNRYSSVKVQNEAIMDFTNAHYLACVSAK